MTDFTITIVSSRPHLAETVKERLLPTPSRIYDGRGAKSFSALVNDAVELSPTEVVIISADKVAPLQGQVRKVIRLLERGYGLVALYRFAFFGFHKELFRRIGAFDERFVGGGYEDDDYMVRMAEADIALYVSEEVEYFPMRSSWPDGGAIPNSPNRDRFQEKWGLPHWALADGNEKVLRRSEPEAELDLDLRAGPPREYLPFSKSVLLPRQGALRHAFGRRQEA